MSVIIPRDIRTNPTSTAVWLASRRRNRLRGGGFNPPVIPGLTVGKTTESGLTFYGFGLGVGSLLPAEFLTTGQNITRLGALDISDFADNGDFANNGDFALATFDKLVLGDGLPDVGSVEVTINGITTTATFNNGSYESTDANAEAIYNLLKSNVGTTYSFDIVEAVPQGNLTFGDTTPLTGFASKGYAGASFPTQVGSLSPDVLLNGTRLDGIYTPKTGDPGSNEIAILAQAGQPNDFGDSSINYNLTFDGVVYLFTFDGSNYSINSAVLKQFIEDKAASGDAIVFTAEEAVTPSSQITVGAGIYISGDPVAGYGINRLQGGGDFGSISPPLLLDGKVVTELSIRNNGVGYPNTIIASGATNIGGLFLNIGDQTFTMSWAGRYGIPGGSGGQQQQQFYDFLVANDGAVLPISITDAPLFSLVI